MRPHPTTGRRRTELIELRDALYAAGVRRGGRKADDFAAADLMISDISGVTAEFLFTEKPTIMPAWANLAAIGKTDTRLAAEYPWTYRWHPETESLIERLDALEAADPLRSRRASAANDMFRGHRSIEEAVRLVRHGAVGRARRKTRVPVRLVDETKRILARVRPRHPAPGSWRPKRA